MRTFLLQPPGRPQGRRRETAELPVAYWAGLLAVGAGMVLLPLSYAGTLVGLLWALVLHMTGNFGWLSGPDAGLFQGAFYLALAFFLAGLPLFLVRPLFYRNRRLRTDLVLDPLAEPRLHAFLAEICKALGAPAPERIHVNMDVNASARFAPGASSLLTGRLEMTLGLPLVRGLDLGQFAGVLAHELGHFGQGGAMRLVHGIRSLNNWFARAAGRKDDWDVALARLSSRLDPLLGLLCLGARACALSACGLLKLHMHAGQAISCLLLRQMEHQADRAAIRLVGGETFAGMVLEAKVLEAAWGLANRSLGMALREGRLADDLPSLVAAHTRLFIPEVKRKMEQTLLQEKTAWFDTHPSPGDRVNRARSRAAGGLFHPTGPASALFGDFPGLARKVTEIFYRSDLGSDFDPSRMLSTSDLVAGQSEIQVGESAVSGYFLGMLSNLRPLWLHASAFQDPGDPAEILASLRKSRARVEAGLPSAAALYRRYAQADARMLDALQAKILLRSNFRIEAGDFQLDRAGLWQAEEAYLGAGSLQRALARELEGYETAMHDRLVSGLRLLPTAKAAMGLPDSDSCFREVTRLVPVVSALETVHPRIESLRLSYHALSILMENLAGHEGIREVELQITDMGTSIRKDLEAIRDGLGDQAYPFGHGGDAEATLAGYALGLLPAEGDVEGLQDLAEKAVGRLYALYFRILGRLALAAGRVEGAMGLGPLEINLAATEAGTVTKPKQNTGPPPR